MKKNERPQTTHLLLVFTLLLVTFLFPLQQFFNLHVCAGKEIFQSLKVLDSYEKKQENIILEDSGVYAQINHQATAIKRKSKLKLFQEVVTSPASGAVAYTKAGLGSSFSFKSNVNRKLKFTPVFKLNGTLSSNLLEIAPTNNAGIKVMIWAEIVNKSTKEIVDKAPLYQKTLLAKDWKEGLGDLLLDASPVDLPNFPDTKALKINKKFSKSFITSRKLQSGEYIVYGVAAIRVIGVTMSGSIDISADFSPDQDPYWGSSGNLDKSSQGIYLEKIKVEIKPDTHVTDFNASDRGAGQTTLSWTNPTDINISETIVKRKLGAYPNSRNDGVTIYKENSPELGKTVNKTDKDLSFGRTYYYAVFTKEIDGPWNQSVSKGLNADIAKIRASPGKFAGGSGAENDPYQIANWYHLNSVRDYPDAHFVLVKDLGPETRGYDDLIDTEKGWSPIGDYSRGDLTGVFDGQEHTISGLFINRPSGTFIGLFGHVVYGVIKNIGLVDIEVFGSRYVGGLVGLGYGVMEDCYTKGKVVGKRKVGGLIGKSYMRIENCYANCKVKGERADIGGLVGDNHDTVLSSYATGDVSGIGGPDAVGGLIGSNPGHVNGSYATGDVSGGSSIGGLIGDSKGYVYNSYATGMVSGRGAVGGLVGINNEPALILESYSAGTVEGSTSVGGLIGLGGGVQKSYSKSKVIGNKFVGGLVGNAGRGKIISSYATGEVTGRARVGGLVGVNYEDIVRDSFSCSESTGQENAVGISTSGEEINVKSLKKQKMMSKKTFTNAGWDLKNVWGIENGNTYPYLDWQKTSPFAFFTYTPTEPKINQAVHFDATGSFDSNGSIDDYSWDWDGDNSYEKTISSPKLRHSFSKPGSYSVVLKVENNDGSYDRMTKTVSFTIPPKTTLQATWNAISPPGKPTNPDPATSIGDDLDSLTLFYNYSRGSGYTAYPSDTSDTDLKWKKGYWIKTSKKISVDMGVTTPTEEVKINFSEPNWHMIGVPYSVDWSQVNFSNPTDFETDGVGNVRLIAWSPEEELYYNHYSDQSYILSPWGGYWIYVKSAPASITITKSSSTPDSLSQRTPLPQSVDRGELDYPQLPQEIEDNFQALAYPNPVTRKDQVTFATRMANVEEIKVVVTNTVGEVIYNSEYKSGSKLTWNLKNTSGNKVPNGIYLYKLQAKGSDSTTKASEVNRLLVLR